MELLAPRTVALGYQEVLQVGTGAPLQSYTRRGFGLVPHGKKCVCIFRGKPSPERNARLLKNFRPSGQEGFAGCCFVTHKERGAKERERICVHVGKGAHVEIQA